MMMFKDWLLSFYNGIIITSLEASVVIIVIFTIQYFVKNRFGSRWRYYLWMILLIRLVIPFHPESNLSIFTILPKFKSMVFSQIRKPSAGIQSANQGIGGNSKTGSENSSAQKSEVVQESAPDTKIKETTPIVKNNSPNSSKAVIKSSNQNYFNVSIFFIAWISGGILMIGLTLYQVFFFIRSLKKNRYLTDQKVLDILEDCKEEMGIHAYLAIIETSNIKSPALFGFIRPKLLLPAGAIQELGYERLKYVFKHELAHLKRMDIMLNWVMTFLQIMHWFNPLIWIAFNRIRAEREILCDSMVLSHSEKDESKEYGSTIIYLLETFSKHSTIPALAGILEEKEYMKRRITMIAQFTNTGKKVSFISVIILILIACSALSDSKDMKDEKVKNKSEQTAVKEDGISATTKEMLNNAATQENIHTRYADLYAKDLVILQDEKTEKGMGYLVISFINNSGGGFPAFNVHFFELKENNYFQLINGSINTAGPIERGKEFHEGTLPFKLHEGKNIISAFIDIPNRIREENEVNNTSLLIFMVKDGKIENVNKILNINNYEVQAICDAELKNPSGQISEDIVSVTKYIKMPGIWMKAGEVSQIDKFVPVHSKSGDIKPSDLIILQKYGVQSDNCNWFAETMTKGYMLSTNKQDKSSSKIVYEIRRIEETDYLFTQISGEKFSVYRKLSCDPDNDSRVIGKWNTVDFVNEISEFKPDNKLWKGNFTLKTISFFDTKKTSLECNWMDGYIYDSADKNLSRYFILNTDGTDYLFIEWMSGDVIHNGKKPALYVLKKETNGDVKQSSAGIIPEQKSDSADQSREKIYQILMSSGLSENEAKQLKSTLQRSGYSPVEAVRNKDRFDVLLGYFPTEEEAKNSETDLKNNGFSGIKIISNEKSAGKK